MEIYRFLNKDKLIFKDFTIDIPDLVKLEKLSSWLVGFQNAKSGDIEGHFELIMLLRKMANTEYAIMKNGN